MTLQPYRPGRRVGPASLSPTAAVRIWWWMTPLGISDPTAVIYSHHHSSPSPPAFISIALPLLLQLPVSLLVPQPQQHITTKGASLGTGECALRQYTVYEGPNAANKNSRSVWPEVAGISFILKNIQKL